MPSKTIQDAVHETAKGLHKADAMDATMTCEFDALWLRPVKPCSAGQVRRLRLRYEPSQAAKKRPNGLSLKPSSMVDPQGFQALG